MGWGPLESRIERLRAAIGRDPEAAEREIRDALKSSERRRDTVRLLGLLSATHRHRRNWQRAGDFLTQAETITKPGDIARAELGYHRALLQLDQSIESRQNWEGTRRSAEIALNRARRLPRTLAPRTDWAKRQNRTRAAWLAIAHVTRGQVSLYGYSDVDGALGDALDAIKGAKAAKARGRAHRAHVSAASLLIACAVRGGSVPDLQAAAEILHAILRELPSSDVIPRAQIRASYACILARQGEWDDAERQLLHSLAALRRVEASNAWNQVMGLLRWVIRTPQRFADLRRELLAQAPGCPPV